MFSIRSFKKLYNDFAVKILQDCYADSKDQNLIISPFSILMLLAVAADATSGVTSREIRKVLCKSLDYEYVMDTLCRIQTAFTECGTLSSANAVCVKRSIRNTINEGYAGHLWDRFNGELISDSDMVSAVNKWVNENTRGMIENIADESMKNMFVFLLNATAFDGKWIEPYAEEDIEYRDFNNADGTRTKTSMLMGREWQYIDNRSFTGFVKPYKASRFSFLALLPKKAGTAAFEKALNSLDFSEAYNSQVEEGVHIFLPEFKSSFGKDLTSYFMSLGINRLFSDQADFSPLSSTILRMDSILHQAIIEVDRHGTRAAAVSMAMACAGGVPQYRIVDLNRPFIYAIVHNGTGLPVFTGIVNQL